MSNIPERSHDSRRLLDTYLRTLSTPQTKKTYNTEICLFIAYVEENVGKELSEITAEDLSLYREDLLSRYSPATVAKKLAALRRFLTFCYMGGYTGIPPEAVKFFAKSPKVDQDPAYAVLTKDELSHILSAARTRSHRDYALLALMSGCGLREAEVVEIRIGDFQDLGGDHTFLKVKGKGEKRRNVPLSPQLWKEIQRYINLSGRSFTSSVDARKPLFPSRVGTDKPLTTRSIQNLVKKYVRLAGVNKPISPHSIRHTVGTNMAVNEAPLLLIQQFLGHSDPKTTLRYIRRAEEMASKAYTYNDLPL